jgi:mannose-1-phosphate guanylyltransferase
MEEVSVGNAIMSDNCENVHVINELDIPVFAMGVKNMVIAVSPDGILVSDKGQSSYIKPYVDAIDAQVMFAEKSWGSYRVLDVTDDSLTVKVTLNPSHSMNYHSHERRDETWTVVSGNGETVIDGVRKAVKAGDVIGIPAGTKHTVISGDETLVIIEVQTGKDISVHDKIKYDMP